MNPKTKRSCAQVALLALAALLPLATTACAMQPSDDGSSEQSLTCLVCVANADMSNTLGTPPPPPPTFSIHALGRMCLDFGGQAYWAPGEPVTLYWCNGTVAQQFNVQEVAGAGHDVTLRAGSYCIGAHGGQPVAGAALEMQTCDGSAAQQFALDGDSIMAGPRSDGPTIARQLVARPRNDVTNAKTPIVLGPRQLTESEYFRFVASDGSSKKPHSGFVTATTGFELFNVLKSATWGTVVELPDSPVVDTNNRTLNGQIPAGVTVRGDRKFTNNGPVLNDYINEYGALLEIPAGSHDVRVTGLRIQGAVSGTDQQGLLTGIRVHDDGATNVIIDHNELSQFTANGIEVHGRDSDHFVTCGAMPWAVPPQPRPTPVRISGNFIHHVIGDGVGYGVVVGYGGFPLVERNTAYENRHTVASAPDVDSGYVATDNFVLSQAPDYGTGGYDHTANFDAHGTLNLNCHDHWGGFAGDYFDFLYNTVLSSDRENVEIRGESCRLGLVQGNVFGSGKDYTQIVIPDPFGCNRMTIIGGAVINLGQDGTATTSPPHLTITADNAYSQVAPIYELAVGDFDGDGIDDLFTTTGTGWFYSSGGVSEWRWLRRATDKASDLRVGDLDGDGRADVIRANGRTIEVSWGGVSSWNTLTTAPGALPITSYAIGNFDNDRLHGDDIFASDGATWYIARSGRNFTAVQTSSVPPSQLRFGDFDGDNRTDVFAVVNGGHWSYSTAAVGSWQALPNAPSNSDNLVTGDFDGDGRTDIGRYYVGGIDLSTNAPIWWFAYSPAARAGFTNARKTVTPAAWSGRFAAGSGVVWWDGNEFDFAHGSAATVRLSRQSMK
jgi:hypothetical protein